MTQEKQSKIKQDYKIKRLQLEEKYEKNIEEKQFKHAILHTSITNNNPIEWLNTTHPKLNIIAISFTINSNFPEYVQTHIKTNWIKINDYNQGTYKKPTTEQELLQKGMEIATTKSSQEVIKYLLTNPHTGNQMSYAESRMMYG